MNLGAESERVFAEFYRNHEGRGLRTAVALPGALEAAIEELLCEGLGDAERLAEIGRWIRDWCSIGRSGKDTPAKVDVDESDFRLALVGHCSRAW